MDFNLVKINKTWLREIDDLYYVGDIVDMDGDGWVSREDAELAVYEYDAIIFFLYCIYSYNLPTATSIIPSPLKFCKALPITEPMIGLCAGLA